MADWYPIKLSFHVRDYAFGERLIPERLGKRDVPPAGRVSETWEISDHKATTGTILNGRFAGRTLHDVTMAHPDEIVGAGWRGPHFPMLGKFLDASHRLPVHLHADDETARRVYDEPNGKTEAWHILWAAPDASILAGIKPGVTREEMVRAFKAQQYDDVMPRHPISAGDTVYVPGGILHSFGPDTLIYEIQQTSDLGQHVMPEDLYGKRLSEAEWDKGIERTLSEMKRDFLPRPTPGLTVKRGANKFRWCAAGPHFALERWTLREPVVHQGQRTGVLLLSNVGSDVTIEFEDGTDVLHRAESCIVPAALSNYSIRPAGEADLVVCHLPNLDRDVIGPLTAAGYSREEIGALGEV